MYYPQANGLVERFNRVVKGYVQFALLQHRPIKSTVVEYLGIYSLLLMLLLVVHQLCFFIGERQELVYKYSDSLMTSGKESHNAVEQLRTSVREKQQRMKMYTD